MEFLEKDLEQIIYESGSEQLLEKGLYVYGKRKRQLKIGNYGVADMVTIVRPNYNFTFKEAYKGIITVYEFKKDKVSVSTFLQAIRYLKGIQRYLESRGKMELYNYQIVLVGREMDLSSSFSYLTDMISSNLYEVGINDENKFSLDVYTYKYKIDGLEFEREADYKLIEEGF